jgi:hypothetical protein
MVDENRKTANTSATAHGACTPASFYARPRVPQGAAPHSYAHIHTQHTPQPPSKASKIELDQVLDAVWQHPRKPHQHRRREPVEVGHDVARGGVGAEERVVDGVGCDGGRAGLGDLLGPLGRLVRPVEEATVDLPPLPLDDLLRVALDLAEDLTLWTRRCVCVCVQVCV